MSVFNYPAACIDEERFTAGRRLLLTGNTTPQAHTHTHTHTRCSGQLLMRSLARSGSRFIGFYGALLGPVWLDGRAFYRERQNGLYIWRHIWLVVWDVSFLATREGGRLVGTTLYGRRLGGMGLNGLGIIYRDDWEGRWDLLGMDGQRRDEDGLGLGYVVEVMKNKSLRLLLAGLFIVPVPVPSIWNRRVPTACHLDISYLLRPSFPRRLSKTAAAASLRPPPRQASTTGQETEQRQPCRRPRP